MFVVVYLISRTEFSSGYTAYGCRISQARVLAQSSVRASFFYHPTRLWVTSPGRLLPPRL